MKAARLLHEPTRPSTDKQRVTHRRFEVNEPLAGLEMDIKFVFVEEFRRQTLVLSVIEVFTSKILGVASSLLDQSTRRSTTLGTADRYKPSTCR